MKPGSSRRLAALATGAVLLATSVVSAASAAADTVPTRSPTGPSLPPALDIDLRATAKDCDTFAVEGRVAYSGGQETGRYNWGPSHSRPELNRSGSAALGGPTSLELENEYHIRDGRGSVAALSITLPEGSPHEGVSLREIGFASLCEKRSPAAPSVPGRQVFATVQAPQITLHHTGGGLYRLHSRGRCPGALRTFTGTITYNGPIPKTGEATVTYYWVRGEDDVKSPPQTAVFTRSGQTVTVRDTWRPAAPSPTDNVDREARSIELEKSRAHALDDSPNPRTFGVLDRFQCTSE
jgi:hypothetical protein